ncbi:MAG: thermonuclease family protein [Planctomycetes bacterium]|nr:thermonuclease family protein [Planctomycetota bacterium]
MRHLWVLSLCFVVACHRRPPPPAATPTAKTEEPLLRPREEKKTSRIPADARRVTCKVVVDGDTIHTTEGEKIRYIGIDTPERGRDGKPDEPFCREATEFNRRLVEGKEILLETDVGKTDKYGRTLAYLWIRDGDREVMVNAEIVRAGLAYVYTFPPNVRYADEFLACQREARAAGRGFWKDYKIGGAECYVATAKGQAFHLSSCKDVQGKSNLRKFKDKGEALDEGLHPCRNCKP